MSKKQIQKKKKHKGRKFNKICKSVPFLSAIKNENTINTIISTTHSRLPQKQCFIIERLLKRKCKKRGKGFIQTYPKNAISKKPSEIRMGKGKGAVNYYISRISPGNRIIEMHGFEYYMIEFFLKKLTKKLPIYLKEFTSLIDKRQHLTKKKRI